MESIISSEDYCELTSVPENDINSEITSINLTNDSSKAHIQSSNELIDEISSASTNVNNSNEESIENKITSNNVNEISETIQSIEKGFENNSPPVQSNGKICNITNANAKHESKLRRFSLESSSINKNSVKNSSVSPSKHKNSSKAPFNHNELDTSDLSNLSQHKRNSVSSMSRLYNNDKMSGLSNTSRIFNESKLSDNSKQIRHHIENSMGSNSKLGSISNLSRHVKGRSMSNVSNISRHESESQMSGMRSRSNVNRQENDKDMSNLSRFNSKSGMSNMSKIDNKSGLTNVSRLNNESNVSNVSGHDNESCMSSVSNMSRHDDESPIKNVSRLHNESSMSNISNMSNMSTMSRVNESSLSNVSSMSRVNNESSLSNVSTVSEGYSSATSFTSLSSGGSGSPILFRRRRSGSPLYSTTSGLMERNRRESSFPQTEREILLLYQERIVWNQERSLLPLAHDLTDWLNSILGLNLIPSTLMENLETGVTLYRLGKLIEAKAMQSPDAIIKPKMQGRMRLNAPRGSFFARDNVAMFINFCKELGVHSNLLFETEDLVSHGETRSILICLLEVGRLSVKYGIDPPALVAFEQQIDEEMNTSYSPAPSSCATEEIDGILNSQLHDSSFGKENMVLDGVLMRDDYKNKSRTSLIPLVMKRGREKNIERTLGEPIESNELYPPEQMAHVVKTQLDLKVSEVERISGKHCCCVEETRNEFRMRKLSEGKYLINGRTVFVRLLKGIHVMVRVGGGWETLEEFLVRNDPCRNAAKRKNNEMNFSHVKHAFERDKNKTAPSTPTGSCPNFKVRPNTAPPSTRGKNHLNFSPCSTPTSVISSRSSSRNSLFV